MKYIDIVYHKPDSTVEDDQDPSCLDLIGTVRVLNAGYVLNMEGRVFFKIETDKPLWMQQLNDAYPSIKAADIALIINTSPEIWKGDIFDIYKIVDPELYQLFDMTYQDGIGAPMLYWKLKSRTFIKDVQPLVDITYRPDGCPMCGAHLDYSDLGEAYCTNESCRVFKYRDISRYLNLACKIHGFNQVTDQLIRADILHSPIDLYDPKQIDESFKVFGKSSRILYVFWDAVNKSEGRVALADYIRCLPLKSSYACVAHRGEINPKGRHFCPRTINKDFQRKPYAFVEMIQRAFDLFYLSEDEGIWMDKSSSLNRYMSFPVFYELAELIVPELIAFRPEQARSHDWGKVSYTDTLNALASLGVFAHDF